MTLFLLATHTLSETVMKRVVVDSNKLSTTSFLSKPIQFFFFPYAVSPFNKTFDNHDPRHLASFLQSQSCCFQHLAWRKKHIHTFDKRNVWQGG